MGLNMELKGGETKVVNSLGQLKLLLWKNFIQKKRSPISTIIEIFSPLALFLVLVFIRSGQPSNPVPTEYNQAVPLPSAGFIPVLQYFCPEVSSDSQGFPDYPYARVSEFLNFISVTLSSNEEYMDLQNVQSQLSMLSAMMEEEDVSDDMFSYFEDIPATGTGMSFEESFMDMDGPSIDMPLSAPTAIDPMLKLIQSYNKIQSELPWLNRLSEQLNTASSENDACRGHFNTTTEEKLDYSDEDYISLGTNSNFKLPKQPTILLLNLWNTFQSVFCGVNNTLNETILEQPDWINEIGFTELQRSKFQQVALLLFKGHPEILYTPNTTEVNTVMSKAAESVRAVTSLTESSMALFNISTQIIALLENRNMQEFYLFLQQSQNNTLNLEPGLESEPPIILPDISSLQQTVESLQKVTCLWNSVMADVDLNFFVPVEDETAMARYFNDADKSNNVTVVAGVVFETNEDGGLPSHVVYKLKLNRTYAPWILSTQDKVWRQSHQHPDPVTDMLFPWLQDVIDRAIIESKTGKLLVEPGGYIREFPNPCHLEDDFLHKGGPPVTILLPILWLFYIISFTHAVVYEKEQRLKEMMKIMGLSSFIHWLSWFLTGLIQVFITVTLLVFVLKYGKLFTFVSPTLLWVFSMSFSVAVVLFCLLVSACFSNAKLGAACACMIHLLFNVPFYYIQNLDILYGTVVTPVVKVLSCMMPPSAYGLGLRYMLYYEFQAIGLQWSNLSSPWPAFYNDITVLQVMLILLIDCAIFVLLTWYVEAVNPGSYGVPQPWYFPFMKSYWCKGHHASRKGSKWKKRMPFHPNVKEFRLMDKYISHAGANGTLLLERRPIGHGVGVHIKDLTKVYKKGKVLAVDGLNLELYTGQITALLGRNGAGKTTVMSILTGFIPPTKGTVLVYGKDIRRQMSLIRQSLGMSPQHDALFDKLTVEEHLWFYSQLKGVSTTNFKTERKKLLTDIGLIEKRHNTINTLSGGMKRKLSVAIAFTGGSKTVILDEPTAGVDPHARRAIWDLLLKYKKGRTILLSTHHMDEASLLGDRIAIISNGYLKFCGSPQYLKNNLGDGYRLTVVKDLNRNVSSSGTLQNGYQPLLSHTSSLRITHFIQEFFPSAKLTSENENELQYLIPLKNTQKSSFIDLFKAMSSRQDKLDISSYAMTEATLEQIFLRVTQEQNDSPKAGKTTANGHVHENGFKSTQTDSHVLEVPANSDGEVHRAEQNNHNTNKWTDGTKKDEMSTVSRLGAIFTGLYVKRLHYIRRDMKTIVAQLIVPLLLITLAVGMTNIYEKNDASKTLALVPSMYMAKPLFVPYSNEAAMFPENLTQYGAGGVGSEDLIRSLHLPAGLGTSTLQSMTVNSTFGNSLGEEDPALFGRHYFDDIHLKYIPENLSASPLETANRQLSSDPQTNSAELTCRCNSDSTGVTCYGQSPSNLPSYQSASGEILQDLTNHNLTKYLLATNQRYRQNRLGALSFGNVRRFVPIDFVTKLNDSSPFRKLASRDAVVAWYSTESTQSRAVFVNVLNNAIFRATLAQSGHVNPSDFGITVVNEPIVTERDVLNRFIVGGTYLKISVLTLIGMSSISASVLIFLVEERASNAKRLQYISGVSPLVYWISNYTWDFLAHVLPIAGCIAIFLAFGVPVYSSVHNILPVVALFVMYSWCVIPLVYPITYAFNVPSTAYMVFFICHVIISYFPTISMLYVEHFAEAELALSIMQTFDSIFLVVPGYCLGHGIILLAFCDVTNAFYKEIGEFDKIQHPFQWDILSRMLVVMAIEGFLFFCIVLLYDYGIFTRFCRICTLKQSEPTRTDEAEDIDVVEERRRVLTNTKADVVRLVNLTKIYKGKKSQKCIAVDGICLGVPKAQCFGLLGINGAGKTTLFQMLTGDQTATQGDAYIHGKSISKNLRGVYRHIGYCPQYDALYSKLTGREHLILYSRLCGVQSKQRKQVVDSMLEKMNLMQYADKQAGTYSGGNKRKLSTAISLIGNPTVLFMDEPTTGMDPKSKRFLWKLINDIAKSGTSVVFTSHSMEECESLCSRLAIMVNGRFKCLGSTQHLKSRFGDGYTITLVLNKTQPRLQQVTSSFKLAFPETVLKDSHLNMVQFELKSRTLVEIFTKLEEMKKTLNIEDYYVRQTTLDDIFINFAKCKNSTSVQGNTVEMNQMKCNTEPEQENLLEENIV